MVNTMEDYNRVRGMYYAYNEILEELQQIVSGDEEDGDQFDG